MKNRILIILSGFFLAVLPVKSQEIKSSETLKTHAVEIRVGADFVKHFDRQNLTLALSEQVRSRVYETDASPYFHVSYTTLALNWHPIPYLKIGAGYTMRLFGDKGWSDPNEFIRHRPFVSLVGQYKVGQWKFSLREKLDINCRADSVNTNEKPAVALMLRHKLQAEYSFFAKPVKLYANCELKHTLNQPTEYINTAYANTYGETRHFGQYLCNVRAYLGVRWRIDKLNSLDFAYRFNYGYERDVNITRAKANVELTHEYEFTHALVITYKLDW